MEDQIKAIIMIASISLIIIIIIIIMLNQDFRIIIRNLITSLFIITEVKMTLNPTPPLILCLIINPSTLIVPFKL